MTREGRIAPGAPVSLTERPYPMWTVALVNEFLHGRSADVETAQALAACPLLDAWCGELAVRLATKKRAT